MVLNCFQNSAEPIKVYKVLVGAFVGNVGKNVGSSMGRFLTSNNFLVFSIVNDNSLKGTKAHAYLQFNR